MTVRRPFWSAGCPYPSYLGTILSEQGDTFKKRLIAALSALDESEWSAVEAFARKLVEQSRDAPPNKESG